MTKKSLIVALTLLVSSTLWANPNTVDVELKQASAVDKLEVYKDGKRIDIIDFHKDQKFIRFSFPEGYSDFDMKVFEQSEVPMKQKILAAYEENREKGVAEFNALWPNHASSEMNAREFQVHKQGQGALVIRNKNVDGTEEGVLHDYILRFTVDGKTYLSDPSIRNRN